MDELLFGWMNEKISGWMDGWLCGWVNGWVSEWVDGECSGVGRSWGWIPHLFLLSSAAATSNLLISSC